MMYIIDTLQNTSNDNASVGAPTNDDHHSELPGNQNVVAEEETHKQKLAQWEQERCQRIQASKICHGILIDFDYTTTIQPDQSNPIGTGDCMVSIALLIYTLHSSFFWSGDNTVHVSQYTSQL